MTAVAAAWFYLLRRAWWTLLPYGGWIPTTAEEIADGANPPPWYAYPLAWLWRLVNRALGERPSFGPRYDLTAYVGGEPRVKPWQ